MNKNINFHSILDMNNMSELLAPVSAAKMLEQALQHLQNGEFALAKFACQQMLNQYGNEEPMVLLMMGIIALQEGSYEHAINYLVSSLKKQPGHMVANFNLAQALLLAKQYTYAEKAYRKVLRICPGMAVAHLGLGQALGYMGQFQDAILNLEQALAQQDKLSPNDIGVAWAQKGMAQGALEQPEDALLSFEKAIGYVPQLAYPYLGRAQALYTLGHHDAAIQSVQQSIEIDPKNATAHFLLGMFLGASHPHKDALRCFDQAVALAPKFADVYYERGRTYMFMNEYGKAARDFMRALEINPNHDFYLHGLGSALVAGKLYKPALKIFTRIAKLHPESAYAVNMIANLERQLYT